MKKIGWPLVSAAVLLAVALLACVIVGIALAAGKNGQTPKESYLLTIILTVISVAAGWVISGVFAKLQSLEREADDQRRQEDLERTTRSAVVRIFRIMREFGQIQGLALGEQNPTELRVRMREINQIARVSFDSASDSIEDWKRLAAAAVEDELRKAIEGQAIEVRAVKGQAGEPDE